MNGDSDSRSRLCPDCRNDSIPTSSCTNCAQARRINELEQTVERLSARVEALEADSTTDAERAGRDITISYAAQLAGVARSTVYDHIEELENMGVIKETREMGQSQYYTLNNDNDLAHELYRLEGIALKNREERD